MLVLAASAQEPIVGSGVYVTKSGSYTGPGDIVSGASYWQGLRAYTAAIAAAATQKAVNVRNTGTNETCDILVATSGGLAGTVTNCSGSSSGNSVSTFCSGGCAAVTMYDQTGNSVSPTQAVAGAQPAFTLSCLGSLPCLTFTAGTDSLSSSAAVSTAQPFTLSIVYNDTSNTNNVIWASFNGSTGVNASRSAANVIDIFAGSHVTATANDNSWHAVQVIYNGASSTINVDNTRSTVNPGAGSTATTCDILGANGNGGCTGGAANAMGGTIAESGLWASGFSTTQQANMCHNQSAYWGTTPC